jgi:hypothetical protein
MKLGQTENAMTSDAGSISRVSVVYTDQAADSVVRGFESCEEHTENASEQTPIFIPWTASGPASGV